MLFFCLGVMESKATCYWSCYSAEIKNHCSCEVEVDFLHEDMAGCPPYTFESTSINSGYWNNRVMTYRVDFGDGTIITVNNPTSPLKHIYSNQTTQNYAIKVELTTNQTSINYLDPATGICGGSFITAGVYKTVLNQTISASPCLNTPALTINTTPSLTYECEDVNFSYTVNPSNAVISNVQWDFGDGSPISTAANPVHQYTGQGVYDVQLSGYTSSGCVSITKQVTVAPALTINTSGSCDNINFSYTSATSLPTGVTINYLQWDFGDFSYGYTSSVSHTYSNSGSYTAKLTVIYSNGCTRVATKVVNVIGGNFSVITQGFARLNCVGDLVTMPDLIIVNGNSTPTSKSWDFGDGSPIVSTSYLASTSHVYTVANTYTAIWTLTFSSGCVKTGTYNIEVDNNVTKTLEIEPMENLCIGSSVQFELNGDVDMASFLWDLDDNQSSILENPTAYYSSAGTKIVSLDVSYSESCVTNPQITRQVSFSVDDYDFCSSCEECIGSFAPEAGGKYVLNAWVKESNSFFKSSYNDASIVFYYEGVDLTSPNYKGNGPIIEGWQQIEQVFDIPDGTTAINIELKNEGNGEAYFDDIRIFPFDANMKSFVYDPITMRLTAELDENNFATYYEYDEDGNLIRVKKETERGVKTIQETIQRIKQKQ